MTDTETLLDAIEQFPDDDTLRGAYADELEKDGYSPRAELIRLGIELANLRCETPSIGAVIEGKPAPCYMCRPRKKKDCLPWCDSCCKREDSMDRQRSLLRKYEPEFRRGPQCEVCKPIAHYPKSSYRDCYACQNTRDAGGLMEKEKVPSRDPNSHLGTEEWIHKVEFVRGFPRVYCRMDECVKETMVSNEDDKGGHRETVPSDWLLSVVRHHRGVEMWVDLPFDGDGARYSWLKSSLPDGVFELVQGHDGTSEYAARTALARAIPAWARGRIQ